MGVAILSKYDVVEEAQRIAKETQQAGSVLTAGVTTAVLTRPQMPPTEIPLRIPEPVQHA